MVSALLAASLVFTPADAGLACTTAVQLVERHTPRDPGTARSALAANFLLDAASAAGADVRRDVFFAKTPKGERRFTNLVASFEANPGKPWVVVVSHYDTKPGVDCPGANDGASTSGLLVAFAGLLRSHRPASGNVMLVWTDGEECMNAYVEDDGLWGSRHAAKSLKERGVDVRAVICVDMLGDRDLHISIPRNRSRPEVLRIWPPKGTHPPVSPVRAPWTVTGMPFPQWVFRSSETSSSVFGKEMESAYPTVLDSSFRYCR